MKIKECIELREYAMRCFDEPFITQEDGTYLFNKYHKQIAVEFPSYKTKQQWQLISNGWIGHIPLLVERDIYCSPKVPLGNLFQMLEYAYRLKSFHFLEGLTHCSSLSDFYERLVMILLSLFRDRYKRGLYRNYLEQTEELPYLTGRMENSAILKPWQIKINCTYHEILADVEENQIIAWTLYRIARSGICSGPVRQFVRKAYRAVKGHITLKEFTGKDCLGRKYNRLNQDYQRMHALCYFFLEQSGPNHQQGEEAMIPFLVNMARLYELFIAEWLRSHVSQQFKVAYQEQFAIDQEKEVSFSFDLVLYDRISGKARLVIDTKYKKVEKPAAGDIAQIVAYATALGVKEAVLLYPAKRSEPYVAMVGEIRVRAISFDLSQDLEEAGQEFLAELLEEG